MHEVSLDQMDKNMGGLQHKPGESNYTTIRSEKVHGKEQGRTQPFLIIIIVINDCFLALSALLCTQTFFFF